MKLSLKILWVLTALCLMLSLSPAALAEDGSGAAYSGESWDEAVEGLIEKYNTPSEGIALGYRNTVTGEEHFYNADQYMVSGSMFKVPLNMLFTEKIYNGELNWDDSIGGYAYSELLNGSIVHSNNDYARTLWLNAGNGTYRTYRQLIAAYMGEDWETVDPKFYENNFFTPRQMIHCLNLLSTESERFPKLIETMQEAEPHKYFKLREQRYDIAHKYGYLIDENNISRLYLCDCAIAYTDDPIVFVMFSDGIPEPYSFMADFATLMCEYAQYNTALRLRAEAEASEAQKKKETESEDAQAMVPGIEAAEIEQVTPQVMPGESGGGVSFGSIIGGIIVAAALVASIFAVLARRKKKDINAPWAILGISLAALAMILSIVGFSAGTLIAKPKGDPQQTAVEFMDAISTGRYQEAYGLLEGYSSLGLENEPADESGRLIYEALKESYSYELNGQCLQDKLSAWQQVQFTFLDLSSLSLDIKARTDAELEAIVKSRPKKEIYDADNKFLPEVTQEAYLNSVKYILNDADDYYITMGIQLQLVYSSGSWRVVPSANLLKALGGNMGN